MQSIVTVVHVLVCFGLIGFVLIQHGKGADAGAAFGSGASSTVFGSQGSGSFLTRATAVLATIFFFTSLSLGYLFSQTQAPQSVVEKLEAPASSSIVDQATTDLPAMPKDESAAVNDAPPVEESMPIVVTPENNTETSTMPSAPIEENSTPLGGG